MVAIPIPGYQTEMTDVGEPRGHNATIYETIGWVVLVLLGSDSVMPNAQTRASLDAAAARFAHPLGRPVSAGEVSGVTSVLGGQRTVTLSILSPEESYAALLEISRAATSNLGADDRCRAVLDAIIRTLHVERSFLFLKDENGELTMRAGRDERQRDLRPSDGYSRSAVKRVHDEQQGLVLSRSRDMKVTDGSSIALYALRSIIGAPILFRGEVVGVIYADSIKTQGSFASEHVSLLQAIGGQIAAWFGGGASTHDGSKTEHPT